MKSIIERAQDKHKRGIINAVTIYKFKQLNNKDRELFLSVLSQKEKQKFIGMFLADENGKIKWNW